MRHRASVAPGKEAPGLEGQGRPSEGVQPSMSTRQLFFATRTPTGGDSTLDPPRRLAWLSGGWHCLAMCTLAAFLTSSDAGSGAARPTSAAPAAAWAALPSALVLTVTAAQRYLHLKWHVDFEDRWMLLDAVDVLAVAAFIVSMLAPADVLTPEGDWVADGAWVRHRAAWPAVVTSLGFAPLLVAATSLHRFLCWRAGAMNTRTAHSTTAVRTRRAVLFANCAVALLAALTGALASSSLWLGNHAQSTAQMETAAGALTAALAATCGGMASDSAAACASAIASASTSAPVCLEALGFAVDGATLYRAPGLSAAESATLSDALAGLLAGGQAWYGRAWVAVRGSGGSHSGVGVFADACFGQEAGALVLAKVLVSAAAVACMLALTWSLYLRAITPLLRALGGVMSCAAFLTDQGLVLTHETDAVDLEPSVERVVRAMRLLIRASFRGRNVVKKLLAEAVNATEHDSGVLQIYGLDLRAWVKQRRQSGWVAKPTGLLPGRADEAPPPSGRMEAAEGITGAVAAMPEASMRRPSKQQSEMPGWFPLMKRKPAQSGGLSADCRVPSAQGPAGLPPCVSVPDVPPWLPHLGTFDWDVLSLSDEAATEAVVEMFRRLGLTDQGPWEPGVFQKPAVFKSRMGDAASRRDASRKDLATASETGARLWDDRGSMRREEGSRAGSGRPLGVVSDATLGRFLREMQTRYNSNPYHHWRHAVDVAHLTFVLLSHAKSFHARHLSKVDLLCAMVAALGHDVGHRGVSNAHLAKTGDVLALTYCFRAIQESMHASALLQVVHHVEGADVLERLRPEDVEDARRCIVDIILETDMACHFSAVGELEEMHSRLCARAEMSRVSSATLDSPLPARPAPSADAAPLEPPEARQLLRSLVHAADLGNAAKPTPLHARWACRVMAEFFREAEMQRELGMAPLPIMDPKACYVPAVQIDFLEFVVGPLFASLSKLLPDVTPALERIAANHAFWCRTVGFDASSFAENEVSGHPNAAALAATFAPALGPAAPVPSFPSHPQDSRRGPGLPPVSPAAAHPHPHPPRAQPRATRASRRAPAAPPTSVSPAREGPPDVSRSHSSVDGMRGGTRPFRARPRASADAAGLAGQGPRWGSAGEGRAASPTSSRSAASSHPGIGAGEGALSSKGGEVQGGTTRGGRSVAFGATDSGAGLSVDSAAQAQAQAKSARSRGTSGVAGASASVTEGSHRVPPGPAAPLRFAKSEVAELAASPGPLSPREDWVDAVARAADGARTATELRAAMRHVGAPIPQSKRNMDISARIADFRAKLGLDRVPRARTEAFDKWDSS